ncbi:hypothetical protein E2C01_083539 [Portunus trituberculatus]|uniref:Uncharacterized protein n=1 Tax=Portunus trituberculatus TaxID=210409 RepID=A0A5B7J2D0_PORTR|nr:hypothetical protein [Portunus trituberculatus]
MDESCEVRRSGRHRTRPLEFWNFEKPEDSTCKTIIYNEIELTRCSVFQLFSRSYYQGSQVNCSDVKEKANPPTSKTAKKTHSKSHSSNKPARKLDISTPENAENSPVIRNPTGSDDTGVKTKKTTSKSRSSKKPARKSKLSTSENAENSPIIRNSTCSNDTGVAAKKTTKSLGSKQPARKSEVRLPKNAKNSPIIRNPCSLTQRGQKRKLDCSEMSEDGTIVNGEDHSLPLKSRSKRRSVSVQKLPGKARTQSLYNNRDSACSPRFKKKKEEKEGNKSSPRKAAGSSPRLTRRRSGSKGLDKQQVMEGRKAAEISESNNNNNNRSDVTMPSQSRSSKWCVCCVCDWCSRAVARAWIGEDGFGVPVSNVMVIDCFGL